MKDVKLGVIIGVDQIDSEEDLSPLNKFYYHQCDLVIFKHKRECVIAKSYLSDYPVESIISFETAMKLLRETVNVLNCKLTEVEHLIPETGEKVKSFELHTIPDKTFNEHNKLIRSSDVF